MARILVSAGPTRQYIDPVRYLTNASSGEMGRALTVAALDAGHEVVVVSGPVDIEYPQCRIVRVLTTEEMLSACSDLFPDCDGMIGVAAPCDYRPVQIADQKLKKTGAPITLQLVETPDIVATLGGAKRADQWVVGFALETEDAHFRAVTKLHKKCCDLVVVNGPEAMSSPTNSVDIINSENEVVGSFSGEKSAVARSIMAEIQRHLISRETRD